MEPLKKMASAGGSMNIKGKGKEGWEDSHGCQQLVAGVGTSHLLRRVSKSITSGMQLSYEYNI